MRDNSLRIIESRCKRSRLAILNEEDRSVPILAKFPGDADEDSTVVRDRNGLWILQSAGQNRGRALGRSSGDCLSSNEEGGQDE